MFTLVLDAPAVSAARLRVSGHLDAAAARDLLHAAADVVRCGCSRLVVDLGGLRSYDDDAAYAVAGCARLARFLPEGVAVLAGSDVGEALADTAGVAPHRALSHATMATAGTMVRCHAC